MPSPVPKASRPRQTSCTTLPPTSHIVCSACRRPAAPSSRRAYAPGMAHAHRGLDDTAAADALETRTLGLRTDRHACSPTPCSRCTLDCTMSSATRAVTGSAPPFALPRDSGSAAARQTAGASAAESCRACAQGAARGHCHRCTIQQMANDARRSHTAEVDARARDFFVPGHGA